MKFLFGLILVFSLAIQAENVRVKKVVDGDTVRVVYQNKNELVRLIGIDTPECQDNERARRAAYRTGQSLKHILELGERSKQFVEQIVKRDDILKIEFDVEKRDRYGRLLGYLFLANGQMLQELVVKNGFALPITVPPNIHYKDKFVAAAREGRSSKRGLWSFGAFNDAR